MTGPAKQPRPFDPRKAAMLDEPSREIWLPTAALLQLLDISEYARVLDYGMGTARYTISAAQLYPQARIVAFDVQVEMLQIAVERVRENEALNVAIVGPDPASLMGPFDRVMAVNVLHEIEDSDLQIIRSLLDPDGFALFVDWNASIPRDFGPPAHHTYTIDEAHGRLECAGFDASTINDQRFPYHYVMRAQPR